MPSMIRVKGMGRRIAFSILGIPQNMRKRKKNSKEEWVNRRLLAEETTRVR